MMYGIPGRASMSRPGAERERLVTWGSLVGDGCVDAEHLGENYRALGPDRENLMGNGICTPL